MQNATSKEQEYHTYPVRDITTATTMIGTATTVAGLGMALYISLEAYSQGGRFAWHPFCMSLGALGLSTAGIQAVRSRRTAEGLKAKTRRTQVWYGLLLL